MAENQTATQAEAEFETVDAFRAALKREVDPRSEQAEEALEQAIQAFAASAMQEAGAVPESLVRMIRKIISEIDKRMTAQINEILHHPKFQKLEGAWRGLQFLCGRTEFDTDLYYNVMPASKRELINHFKDIEQNEFDQGALFKAIHDTGYDMLGGRPVACIVGDYHFDHGAEDISVMRNMSKIAAVAHAPFLAGADPALCDCKSWQDLPKKGALGPLMDNALWNDWNDFRSSDDSRYVGLAMPRFLGRRPYGEQNRVDEFEFVEETGEADADKFCWVNAAYGMAHNVQRAFKQWGWCAQIRGVNSGGALEELPTHTYTTESGLLGQQPSTEVMIGDRRENELADLGVMPLLYEQHTTRAAFLSAQSVHKPPKFADNASGRDATQNAKLGARLPYMFATCRFAHNLKVMIRYKIGQNIEREDLEVGLNNWIQQYILKGPQKGDSAKLRRPLADAKIKVLDDPENPGFYHAKVLLRPHYQLEGANIALSLVANTPQE